ncbi:2-oxoglutarate-dependent dioxygenase DAO-like [Abrus precatorius]|uniref:2-oxoglutarate-dependent dioxygenase DAO n=1 Tax=Abrus precatorius TaxID=3816 RepID=A0A8B8M0K3_ABRPR|nr:2-oxoglutarate-dependent dioxygenase DAO-like [Abrus precatorius]
MEGTIPVIDLEKISDPDESKKLREACEKWGCFRIINHSISTTLMADMKEVIAALFDRPTEMKNCNSAVIAGSGYMAPSAVNPLYEALSIYDFCSSQAMNNFCSQLDVSPHQRQIVEAYGQAIHGLTVKIGQKMAESVGVVDADFEDWICQFRINNYHFTPEAVGSSGVQIHTDSSFLTVLQDDENVGGLEVMHISGSFVPVPPLPTTLLVNLGDIGHVWSNGRFRNVEHRVICKEARKRLSIATFMLGPRNGNVEAPAELVSHDHPRLHQPFVYEDYRKARVSNKMHSGQALQLFRVGTMTGESMGNGK